MEHQAIKYLWIPTTANCNFLEFWRCFTSMLTVVHQNNFLSVAVFSCICCCPEKIRNLANFAAVLHDCVFTSATEMDSNGRTFSVLVPQCLLLCFWKMYYLPKLGMQFCNLLSRVNVVQRLSNHHTTPGPPLQLSVWSNANHKPW